MSIFGAMNIAYSGLVVNRKWLDAIVGQHLEHEQRQP